MSLVLLLGLAGPASAQDSTYGTSEYGGGWASPSLDVSLSIGRDVLNKQITDGIIRDSRAAGKTPRDAAPRAKMRVPAVTRPPVGRSLFAAALAPGNVPNKAAVRTDFERSAALQKQSEAALLAQIRGRGVPDQGQYEKFFRDHDIAAEFEKGARGYGLKANDAADALTGYMLTAWIVANGADDFSVAAARAARAQIGRGMAMTAVGGYDRARLHRLADEAMFNCLMLTQMYHLARQGTVSAADYRRVGDATWRGFLGFGADLRALKLTDKGFAAK